MYHDRIDSDNFKDNFENEIKKFEILTKKKSRGFRAPTFSLNQKSSWIIDSLVDANYLYDSSIVPVQTKLYGIPGAEKNPYLISSKSIAKNDPDGQITEFPLLTTKIFGKTIPAGGGFYVRTLPLSLINKAIKDHNSNSIPATFYIHSW